MAEAARENALERQETDPPPTYSQHVFPWLEVSQFLYLKNCDCKKKKKKNAS